MYRERYKSERELPQHDKTTDYGAHIICTPSTPLKVFASQERVNGD